MAKEKVKSTLAGHAYKQAKYEKKILAELAEKVKLADIAK